MTKNPFKLKIIDDLPFFGNIPSFLNFKDSSFKIRGWAIFEKALLISLTFLCAFELELLYWRFRFVKARKESVFVSNYRIRTRTLITTNCKKLNTIQFVIAFFPFIFTFSFLIRSRYKEQLFSYPVKDTLPGICASHQNLSWETFREITSKKVVSFSDEFSTIATQKYKYFASKVEDYQFPPLEVVNLADSNRKHISHKNEGDSILLKSKNLTSQTDQDFIERVDVSSNLILLEMKPAWEQKQKQFYIGFLPKKNQINLNKLRIPSLFLDRKQKVAKNESVNTWYSFEGKNKSLLKSKKVPRKAYFSFLGSTPSFEDLNKPCFSNLPLQIKNIKNNNKEKFYEHKFYARKQNFLRSYKDKIDFKTTLINKKPNLINVFSKQQFQQKFFDLDELPLKLDQNYFVDSKPPENLGYYPQAGHTAHGGYFPMRSQAAHTKTTHGKKLLTQGSLIPNLFRGPSLQTFSNPIFTSDLLGFSSNKERKIHNIENGIADQTNLYPLSSEENDSAYESEENDIANVSEENESANVSEENDSADVSEENDSADEGEENDSADESEENDSADERLPLPNEPTQKEGYDVSLQEDQKPNFITDLLKKFHKDGEEAIPYRKHFVENVYYNQVLVFLNSNQAPLLQILNLEKNHRPFGKGYDLPSVLIQPRLMSGYEYPDMEITNLRSLRIQNLYKNIIFQKQNKEILSMKIELPSSFLTNKRYNESQQKKKKGYPVLTIPTEGPLFPNYDEPEVSLGFESVGFFPFASTNKNIDPSLYPFKNGVNPKGFTPPEHVGLGPSHAGIFVRALDEDGDSLLCGSEDPNESSLPDKNEEDESKGHDEWGELYEVGDGYEGYKLVLKRNEGDFPCEGKGHDKGYEIFVGRDERVHKIGTFFKIPQLKYHYLPTSQTFLNKSLIEKLNISGIYQKVATIYKQDINLSSKPFDLLPLSLWGDFVQSNLGRPVRRVLVLLKPFLYIQKPFREFWEPVTIQSWLVITKLSFAFITLKMTQTLLLNYGKELVFLDYLSDNLKEEIGLTDNKKDKGYRLFKKVEKRFKDVAGIDNILPDLGELVWVLRNSNPSFKVGRVIPKGYLFVGPPGTGKTLLAQAIAGEAEVPVFVQSGSSLTDPREYEKGAQRLKNLFEQARKVTPCIVFIDEIDTLGESRQNVMSNQVGGDDLIQSLHKSNQGLTGKGSSDYVNTDKAGNLTEKKRKGSVTRSENLEHDPYLSIQIKNQAKQQANQEQLNLLVQFLLELDGVKSRAGIIVIGATNRPKVLDPALTRPGRFDRVLNLELPGKTKRIEILKLYSQNIGLVSGETKNQNLSTTWLKYQEQAKPKESLLMVGDKARDTQPSIPSFGNHSAIASDISNTNHALYPKRSQASHTSLLPSEAFGDRDFAWEYLANRTFGFSAADLAAAMNVSSIQAILRNTGHTIETIEQGIEFITTYSIEKPKIESTKENDPFFITRFAYYQAGKAVLHTLLPQHPDAIVLKLWPQPKNSRHKNVNLHLTYGSLNHRAKLETRLIGLYAGKAAELVALSLNSQTKKQTTKWPFTRKITSTIKENKGLNRKTVSSKNTLRNRYVITSPKQNLTNQDFSQYNKRNFYHSYLGIEDLSAASNLAHSLVEKWHFYSNKIAIRRENQIFTNQNQFEISEIGVFELFHQLTEDVQNRISASNISESLDKKEGIQSIQSEDINKDSPYIFQEQERSIRPWWQKQITEQSANLNMFYDDWYRIYISDPKERERNVEWVAPEEYYHNTQNLKNLLPKYSYRKNSYLLPTFKTLTNPKIPGCVSYAKDKKKTFADFSFVSPPMLLKSKIRATTSQASHTSLFPSKGYEAFLLNSSILTRYSTLRKKGHKGVSLHKGYYQEKQEPLLLSKTSTFKTVASYKVKEKNNRSKNKKKAFEGRREFIFKNRQIKNKLNFDLTWNDLYKLDRDYIYHALILTTFNKAFCLLDENRELLDYLADYLMRFETLRQHKIKQIFYDFGYSSLPKESFIKKGKKDKQKINFIFDKKWGKTSRRCSSRLFSFDQ